MYLKNYSNRNNVPQTEPIPGREEDQAQNHAGGFSFKISLWDRLERFLILGTEGGSYYVGEREMTKENITVVKDALKEDGARDFGDDHSDLGGMVGRPRMIRRCLRWLWSSRMAPLHQGGGAQSHSQEWLALAPTSFT